MDLNTLRSLVTLISFLVFIGIVLWAMSGSNRERFREASMLPFADDELAAAIGDQHVTSKTIPAKE